MASPDEAVSAAAMKKYGNLEERFTALGGYAAEAEAASIASNLSLPDRILDQPLSTLSGGQRRRIELARILFSGADTMLLDEPTNHLDADSVVWLRDFLKNFPGGLIVISHDIELVQDTVNKVFYLDANRQTIDITTWAGRTTRRQRAADEERRKKERANAEKKAAVLTTQAAKFGAKASKAAAAHQMVARAEKLLAGLDEVRTDRPRREAALPGPGRLRPHAAHGIQPVQELRLARDLRGRRPRDRPRFEGRRPRASTARARRRCCASSPASTSPTRARSSRATACASATTRRSTRPSTSSARCSRTWCRRRRTSPRPRPVACSARSCSRGMTRSSRPACFRWREDPARSRDDRRLRRERAAAGRADQQPRPRVSASRSWMRWRATRAPWCWYRTTRAPSRRSTRSGCSSCLTASRTTGTATTQSSSRWRSRQDAVSDASGAQ